jgi:hypothetical protein
MSTPTTRPRTESTHDAITPQELSPEAPTRTGNRRFQAAQLRIDGDWAEVRTALVKLKGWAGRARTSSHRRRPSGADSEAFEQDSGGFCCQVHSFVVIESAAPALVHGGSSDGSLR